MRVLDMPKVELDARPASQHKEVHIFVDFDATLAEYESWDKQGHEVGKPIKKMVDNVKRWLKKDYKVSIFTARLSHGYAESDKQVHLIQTFLKTNGLPENLPITCIKAHWATHFVDDRAYHVIPNTGIIEGNMGI